MQLILGIKTTARKEVIEIQYSIRVSTRDELILRTLLKEGYYSTSTEIFRAGLRKLGASHKIKIQVSLCKA